MFTVPITEQIRLMSGNLMKKHSTTTFAFLWFLLRRTMGSI